MLSFLCHRLSAGTSAYWLWLNYSFEPQDCCLATWSMSMTVWGLTGQSAGSAAMMGEWKWSTLSPLTPLHQQKRYTCSLAARWVLALIQHRCFSLHHQLYYAIKHSQHAQMSADELISAARATRWCVTMMHVFGGIDHLKLLKLREFMPTAWQ